MFVYCVCVCMCVSMYVGGPLLDDRRPKKSLGSIQKDHRTVIVGLLVISLIQYANFALDVIQQICQYLDIGCLYIKNKPTETGVANTN
ncbi:hypothetical protein BCR42DRAFT_407682 [Absidia repens]|uniref:Uncharacterized protein n=1 Tax=Absidia repens TaxID=90262 RepID=A0A1X2ISK4_9FUNG|nr:hypothetical protein BCR42DRAFT_407682 [Absidia repens]